ncbi:MAG: hypothetical protein ABI707_13085 [Ferruginibacter sp.]
MKIENIIEDIKNDIIKLGDKLEEEFKRQNPGLNCCVSLPGIEELATIKSIALSIEENNTHYYLSVLVHTHNGNRVFENEPKEIINNYPVPYYSRHPCQDKFVNLLRDIIKKNKHKMKSGNKSGNFYNDAQLYANSVY